MRRKRLNHAADILCQMFCGWRLINCKPELVELGSGLLEIDVISGACKFNGQTTAELTIAGELREWLKEDFNANNILADHVDSATLRVDLSFSQIPWRERRPNGEQFFADDGEIVETTEMHQCIFKCSSEIKTDEKTYRAELEDLQQWPMEWPER